MLAAPPVGAALTGNSVVLQDAQGADKTFTIAPTYWRAMKRIDVERRTMIDSNKVVMGQQRIVPNIQPSTWLSFAHDIEQVTHVQSDAAFDVTIFYEPNGSRAYVEEELDGIRLAAVQRIADAEKAFRNHIAKRTAGTPFTRAEKLGLLGATSLTASERVFFSDEEQAILDGRSKAFADLGGSALSNEAYADEALEKAYQDYLLSVDGVPLSKADWINQVFKPSLGDTADQSWFGKIGDSLGWIGGEAVDTVEGLGPIDGALAGVGAGLALGGDNTNAWLLGAAAVGAVLLLK